MDVYVRGGGGGGIEWYIHGFLACESSLLSRSTDEFGSGAIWIKAA